MKMIIGGAFQGKLSYGIKLYPDIDWTDGAVCPMEAVFTCDGIYNFQEYIRRLLCEKPEDASELAEKMIARNPEIVIISDEIGCGLVPVDGQLRAYREQAGRICTKLAAYAGRVDRVICGIGTVIRNRCEEGKETGLTQIRPADIEKRSFEMITEELGDVALVPGTEAIVKRCIHTSADFEYARNLKFSPQAVEQALAAIRGGASIVTDTQMGKSGINKKKLAEYGGEVYCFMSDEDVAEEASKRGITRAAVSMERAAALEKKLIFAIGNAPTALVRIYELIQEGRLNPELVIAVPVGFVNVVQSKELILKLEHTPYIVAQGRKGGSNIAACICNALLYMPEE